MHPLQKKLLAFTELDKYEQRDLVERLIDAPETFALVEDEDLASIFLQVPDLPADHPATRAALAYVATYHYWSTRPPSGEALALFTRVKAQLRERPDLRAEFEAIEARALHLDTVSDPVRQFEALTGRQLVPNDSNEATRPDRPSRRRSHSVSSHYRWLRQDLPATPSIRIMGQGLAAIAGLLIFYGILAATDYATRSDLQNIAYEEASAFPPAGSFRSGLDNSQQIAEQLILDAVREVIASRETTLGLFPRYDEERLRWAEEAFRQVLRNDQADAWLRGEAGFLLGAVLIAEGRAEEARRALEEVSQADGPRAEQARTLLEQLAKSD